MLPLRNAIRPNRQVFFRLPPDLRAALLQPPNELRSSAPFRPRTQAFHSSQRRGFDAHTMLEAAMYLPHQLIVGAHGLGLSWAASIALSAVVVRTFIILPCLTIPSRKAQERALQLMPLRDAWASTLRRRDVQISRLDRDWTTLTNTHTRALAGRWGITNWHTLVPTLLQLPVFLTLAETIRRMAGARSNLLGMLADWADPVRTETDGQGEGLLESLSPSWFEPGFATGGQLWFLDLTAPDPTLTLPFMVSGITFLHIYASSPNRKGSRSGIVRRALLTLALFMGPLILQVESGVLVYWVASTASNMAVHFFLDVFRPLPNSNRRCKRVVMDE